MSKKQTAVEWLWDKLSNNYTNTKPLTQLLNEAKQLERQQIIDAYKQGYNDGDSNSFSPISFDESDFDDAEFYYNETYNQ